MSSLCVCEFISKYNFCVFLPSCLNNRFLVESLDFPSETVLWIHVAHRFYCSLDRSTLSFAMLQGKDGQGWKVPALWNKQYQMTQLTGRTFQSGKARKGWGWVDTHDLHQGDWRLHPEWCRAFAAMSWALFINMNVSISKLNMSLQSPITQTRTHMHTFSNKDAEKLLTETSYNRRLIIYLKRKCFKVDFAYKYDVK